MADYISTGVFATAADATEAICRLDDAGFRESQVSVLMSDAAGEDFKIQSTSKLPEGAAIGAGAGGAIGALVAGLTAVGAIATGGAGVLVAGPIVAALAGAGAGSAAGGVVGAMVGYGINEHQAKLFAKDYEDGKVLVAVRSNSAEQRKTADRVLEDAGGEHVRHG